MNSNNQTTILIIDDEPIIRQSFAFHLEDRGYRTITAKDGRVGLEILARERPHLVLTDLLMPEVDGMEVIRIGGRLAPDTPIIVVSGAGRMADAIQALRLGAYDYLLKPVRDLSILEHTVGKALEKARLQRENRAYQEDLETRIRERTAELEQANTRLSDINERLTRVVETTRGLSTCTDVAAFGATLLDEFAKHMRALGGSLFLVEKGGLRRLRVLETSHAPAFIPFPLPEGSILGRTIEEEKPILITDIAHEKAIRPSGWDGYRDGSALTFPLLDEAGRVIGVLTLHNKTPPPFIEQDKEIGAILASHGCETLRAARTMESLRASEKRFKDLAKMLPEAVFETDRDLKLIFANQRAFELFGYSGDDFALGLNGLDLFAPRERERAVRAVRGEESGAIEYRGARKDETTFPMLLHMSPIMDRKTRTGFRGVAVDITDRKRTEEALLKSEEKYRTIIRESPVGICYYDREGVVRECNKRFVDIVGSTYEKLIGFHMPGRLEDDHMIRAVERSLNEGNAYYEDWYSSVTSERRSYIKVLLKGIRNEKNDIVAGVGLVEDMTERRRAEEERRESERRYRTLFARATDAIFIVDRSRGRYLDANKAAERLTGRPLSDLKAMTIRDVAPDGTDDRLAAISESGRAGNVARATYARPDGKKRIAVLTTTPLDDETVIDIARDITDELAMESQLRQAQKMEAIGALAGGIAHDFNNILTAILGYSELGLLYSYSFNPLRKNLEEIHRSGKRAQELVAQILAFSRAEEQATSPVGVDPILKEALKLLRPAIPSTIEIRQRIDTNGAVLGDPTRIHQIIMNLCTNAYQAMSDAGGVMDISLSRVEIEHDSAGAPPLPPGPYLRLTVSDTGCGISPENLDRIFDPYFTTKDKGKGTGLGLSVVHGIVIRQGGAVTVKSRAGEGTEFNVYLPSIPDEGVEYEESERRPPGGNERILLVDDEKDMLAVEKMMLEKLGYRVTATDMADEALTIFNHAPERFDLVVTDLTMPNLTGIQLAAELKKIAPDVGVIICTGYSEKISVKNIHDMGLQGYIPKPISVRELAETIRNALDGARGY